jgi:hypothetical protein
VHEAEQDLVQSDGERERNDQSRAVPPEIDHRPRPSPRERRRLLAEHEPGEP